MGAHGDSRHTALLHFYLLDAAGLFAWDRGLFDLLVLDRLDICGWARLDICGFPDFTAADFTLGSLGDADFFGVPRGDGGFTFTLPASAFDA